MPSFVLSRSVPRWVMLRRLSIHELAVGAGTRWSHWMRAAACAVAAGARSYAAVGHWLRPAPRDALAGLGIPVRGALGVRLAASMDTVRRSLNACTLAVWPRCCGLLYGEWPACAAGGKSARGSRTRTRTAVHLLAVIDQDCQVIAQLRVPDKTSESPAYARCPARWTSRMSGSRGCPAHAA